MRWLVPLLFAAPALAQPPKPDPAKVFAAAVPSTALILVDRGGKEFRATGFVVDGPGGVKRVVTCAHVLAGGDRAYYLFPGMDDFKPFDGYALHPAADLALLFAPAKQLADRPALTVARADAAPPKVGTRLVVTGHPLGTRVLHKTGDVEGEPISVGQLAEDLGAPLKQFGSLSRDLKLIRHGVPTIGGLSGAAVMDLDARVVGVQVAQLPGGADYSFAVPAAHLADKQLQAAPTAFAPGKPLALGSPEAVAPTAAARDKPVVKIDGTDVDVRCFHRGYVGGTAQDVIAGYIQDRKRFENFFTEERLAAVMKKTQLAHITNPAFGFSMLVPKGYLFSVTPVQKPAGVIVTFTHPDAANQAPPYDQPLTIRVRVHPEAFREARTFFNKSTAVGEQKAYVESLSKYERFRFTANTVRGLVNDEASVDHALQHTGMKHLKLVYSEAGGNVVKGNVRAELFTRGGTFLPSDLWTRYNFDSEKRQLCHAVHVGLREPSVGVIHFAFNKADREAILAGKEPDPVFRDYALIAATVNLY